MFFSSGNTFSSSMIAPISTHNTSKDSLQVAQSGNLIEAFLENC